MGRQYFYSHGGRVVGPLSSAKLREHASSGKLLPTDVVWRLGELKRVPATEVKGLFRKAAPAASQAERTAEVWFFSRGQENFGPCSFVQLEEYAITGQLLPTDLVWKDGMPQWVEAGSLDILFADEG